MAYPPATLDTAANDGKDAATGAQTGPTTVGDHATRHNQTAGAINDIVTELGANPSGTYATVQDAIANAAYVELGYFERTSDVTGLTTGAITTITGSTSNITSTGRPLEVTFGAYYATNTTANCGVILYLYENNVQVDQVVGMSISAGQIAPLGDRIRRRTAVAAGTVLTYELRAQAILAGTGTIAGGTAYPIRLGIRPV